VIIDIAIYVIALALFMIHRYKSKQMTNINVRGTDLGHVALAVVAANSLTMSPYGALASVMMTALYVTYQWWQDKSPKDIAVYTGAFATVVATKLGISIVGL
jgi:phosphatidylserine synthase